MWACASARMVKLSLKRRRSTALLERVLGWQAGGLRNGRGTARRRRRHVRLGGRRILILALLLKLQLLLLPRGQSLLLSRPIVGIADRAAHGALLLRLGLERLPDHVRLSFFAGRECAEHRFSAGPVDPHPADSWRSDEGSLLLVLERAQRPLLPDRCRDPA